MEVANQASNDGGVVSVAVADIDGDGVSDIVVGRGGFDASEMGVLEILFGPFSHPDACNGSVVTARAARTSASAGALPFAKVTTGDIDHDGCVDIVAGNFDGGIELFLGKKNGARCELGPRRHVDVLDASVGGTDLELADLDADGSLDLVVARSDRDHPTKAHRQVIVWNRSNQLDFDHPWVSDESLVATFATLVGDFDGDGALDIVFGARGMEDNAAGGLLSGTLHRGVKGKAPLSAPVPLSWPAPGPNLLSEVPYVVDIDRWGPGVMVVSSGHWCSTVACWRRTAPIHYAWSGTGMGVTSGIGAPPGNWLPGSSRSVDGDSDPDAVYPLACGTWTQRPGRVELRRSAVANYDASRIATPDEVIRSVVADEVDATAPGLEFVIGGARLSSNGGPTNSGHVSLIVPCPNPRRDP